MDTRGITYRLELEIKRSKNEHAKVVEFNGRVIGVLKYGVFKSINKDENNDRL